MQDPLRRDARAKTFVRKHPLGVRKPSRAWHHSESRFSPLEIRLEKPVCGTAAGFFVERSRYHARSGEVAEWLKAAPC